MNTKSLKVTSLAVLLLTGTGATSPAMATPTGLQFLGAEFAGSGPRIDTWTFTCPAGLGFIGAAARVNEIDPAPLNPALMQVVLGKDGLPTIQQTAPNGGASLYATNLDGTGTYAVTFKKTAAGLTAYKGNVFCVRASSPLNTLIDPPGGVQMRINQ